MDDMLEGKPHNPAAYVIHARPSRESRGLSTSRVAMKSYATPQKTLSHQRCRTVSSMLSTESGGTSSRTLNRAARVHVIREVMKKRVPSELKVDEDLSVPVFTLLNNPQFSTSPITRMKEQSTDLECLSKHLLLHLPSK